MQEEACCNGHRGEGMKPEDKSGGLAGKLRYSEEGLAPVVVQDAQGGGVLMLAYANREAVEKTLSSGMAHFYSRSRQGLWKKGETSGNQMEIVSVSPDCDMDALLYRVRVLGKGVACHTGKKSCFSQEEEDGGRLSIGGLAGMIDDRVRNPASASYTSRLAASGELACAKIEEESAELVEALREKEKKEIVWEACDLIYHALVAAMAKGVKLSDLEREFGRRNAEKKEKELEGRANSGQ